MNVRMFTNGLENWAEELQKALTNTLTNLGLDDQVLPLRSTPSDVSKVAIAFFFSDGSTRLTSRDLSEINSLLEHGIRVLPVVDTAADFRRKVPDALGKLNAFILGKPAKDWDSLVAELIDRAWNLRSTRKIFLSYRRIDSSGIAAQLQSELTHRGYDVFLDESSIPPGANFQRELMSWLNDSDFVLLLASPRLEESEWVLAEIERANLSSVGVLGICWPISSSDKKPAIVDALMDDQRIDLRSKDLEGNDKEPLEQTLSKERLGEVLGMVDRYRALAIRNRLTDLVPLFIDCVTNSNVTLEPAGRFGDFWLTLNGGHAMNYVRITPFRPTLSTLSDLWLKLKSEDDVRIAACFYFENDVNDPQKVALEWATRPDRPAYENGPRQFRLIAYEGVDLNLDWVDPDG